MTTARRSDPPSPLATLLTERALRLMAGAATFERGERYATSRRVKKLTATASELSSTVIGTRGYEVRIGVDEGTLAYECSCPVGEREEFCKHCVAAGLAWLRGVAEAAQQSTDDVAAYPAIDVRAYLLAHDKETLVELLMERAATDDLFEAKLALQAATASSLPRDVEPYRQAIERAIVVDDFIDYRSMYDYSSNVSTVIQALEGLLGDGQAAEVIGLCEYALECVEDALGRVDDSDGQMGEIRDQLVEIHHAACLTARPDPGELAERLFEWGIHSEWEIFLDGVERYTDVLGDVGLARYRALAERVWAQVPARDGNEGSDRWGSSFRITYIMEALARTTGSVDDRVAIKARDLTHAYAYFQIVELYADAGRFDEALEWAERGLAAFPERTDERLRDVAARELSRAGRSDEAMTLIWDHFQESPNASSYQFLHRHATAVGKWRTWRERALQLLRRHEAIARSRRAESADSTRGTRAVRWMPPDGLDRRAESSELVSIFLWERDPETAWTQAVAGGCSPGLWMQLAAIREGEHPNDAIPIYQAEVERAVGRKDNRGYQEGVEAMLKVRALMSRAGRGGEFSGYAVQVRAAHKAKRNLMKLFDGQGW